MRRVNALSAGILAFRIGPDGVEVLLAHAGGPFWRNKDLGAWSIPKGEIDPDEKPLAAAVREFQEETGCAPAGHFLALGEVKQAGGKVVIAFAVEADIDAEAIRSNSFTMEWPPRSGKMQEFPEIDRAGWFDLPTARAKINPAQAVFLERLELALSAQH